MLNKKRKAAVLAASIIALPALTVGTPAQAASGDNSSEGAAIVLALAGGLVFALSGHSGGHGQGNDSSGAVAPLLRPVTSGASVGTPSAVYAQVPASAGSAARTGFAIESPNPTVLVTGLSLNPSPPAGDAVTGTGGAEPEGVRNTPISVTLATGGPGLEANDIINGTAPFSVSAGESLTAPLRSAALAAAVPEPSPGAAVACGLLGLLALAARRRTSRVAR